MSLLSDEYFMALAIKQAQEAFEKDEVPVGAIIVANNTIVAKAHNLTETLTDVTAHAEIQAITAASVALGAKYLHHCTMYVTLEPCVMCAGAIYWSQLDRVVIGTSDPKRGFISSALSFHPRTSWIGGVLEQPCADLLKEFFKNKR